MNNYKMNFQYNKDIEARIKRREDMVKNSVDRYSPYTLPEQFLSEQDKNDIQYMKNKKIYENNKLYSELTDDFLKNKYNYKSDIVLDRDGKAKPLHHLRQKNPDYIYDTDSLEMRGIKKPGKVFIRNEKIEERIKRNEAKFANKKGAYYYSAMNLDGNTKPEDEEDIAYMRYKCLYEEISFIPNNSFMINLKEPRGNYIYEDDFVNGYMIPLGGDRVITNRT